MSSEDDCGAVPHTITSGEGDKRGWASSEPIPSLLRSLPIRSYDTTHRV